jgi:hypothetical protein
MTEKIKTQNSKIIKTMRLKKSHVDKIQKIANIEKDGNFSAVVEELIMIRISKK